MITIISPYPYKLRSTEQIAMLSSPLNRYFNSASIHNTQFRKYYNYARDKSNLVVIIYIMKIKSVRRLQSQMCDSRPIYLILIAYLLIDI